ncbi:hypothetical protein [Aquipseudomonas alcaligenes]|uniref:Ypar28 n=1 Tax=Aquipseudomonas alcaligenes TaxID=43263 RepID=Q939E5_AQUAC|nr:hypothetical protein [Pseudomonas alcaligenes]AAK73313.1 Ypar28 [Pseudomonas alcaligenes]
MPATDQRSYEIATLKCFINTFEDAKPAKKCTFCKYLWLAITAACGAFVYIAYNYTEINTVNLLIISAFGGASGSMAGFYSSNSRNTEILKPHVNLESLKSRLEELET